MNKFNSILWGVGLILAAVLLIGSNMGILNLGNIGWFSIVLTVFLGVILINGIVKISFFEILMPLAGLCIIYDKQLGLEEITPWPVLGAALLCTIGLEIIFKTTKKRWSKKYNGKFKTNDDYANGHTTMFGDDNSEVSDDVVQCNVKFGSTAKYINSQAFERAEIDCSFGDAKIYLTDAMLKGNEAEIYVNVSFGDVKIYMPRTWRVECSLSVSLGDYKEKGRREYVENAPVIYLSGSVSLADVVVEFM